MSFDRRIFLFYEYNVSMNLYCLFEKTLNANYTHVENSGDYATIRDGEALYIFLECSHGNEDWKNNLDFPIKFQFRDDDIHFRCHRGFLRVWESIRNHIKSDIMDTGVKKIVISGYSHGAGIAVLCHEYAYHHRPDLRGSIEGYGFGCPRVLWGRNARKIAHRWADFYVIRNYNDLITHLPPAVFGYFHVGKRVDIGVKGKYNMIDAHRPENYLIELKKGMLQ